MSKNNLIFPFYSGWGLWPFCAATGVLPSSIPQPVPPLADGLVMRVVRWAAGRGRNLLRRGRHQSDAAATAFAEHAARAATARRAAKRLRRVDRQFPRLRHRPPTYWDESAPRRPNAQPQGGFCLGIVSRVCSAFIIIIICLVKFWWDRALLWTCLLKFAPLWTCEGQIFNLHPPIRYLLWCLKPTKRHQNATSLHWNLILYDTYRKYAFWVKMLHVFLGVCLMK